MVLNGQELVEKRNVLNQIKRNNMTLQELRLFSIYLAKINARDESTRVVRFLLTDFQNIMELGRININYLTDSIDKLLTKVVHVPIESGGFETFQLFKKCKVDKDENNEWYIEINAHDDALPLMFDFKRDYFTYELWNALACKSVNQLRMYELLKQYEYMGKLEISVDKLRDFIGIENSEYSRFERFRTRVLDGCQQALAENTDITYTYEHGKIGAHGKWKTIIFHIKKNENHVDKLELGKFLKKEELEISLDNDLNKLPTEHLKSLSAACCYEFPAEDIIYLGKKLDAFLSQKMQVSYLKIKYEDMLYHNSKNPIKNRFAYLKRIIDLDYLNYLHTAEKENQSKTSGSNAAAYNLEEYDNYSVADEMDDEMDE